MRKLPFIIYFFLILSLCITRSHGANQGNGFGHPYPLNSGPFVGHPSVSVAPGQIFPGGVGAMGLVPGLPVGPYPSHGSNANLWGISGAASGGFPGDVSGAIPGVIPGGFPLPGGIGGPPLTTELGVHQLPMAQTEVMHADKINWLREFETPIGYIPLDRRMTRQPDNAHIQRAQQWGEIAAWRFHSDPSFQTAPMKYSVQHFVNAMGAFSQLGWNFDSCVQILLDLGFNESLSENWCGNIDPWGHDECNDLSWPDFLIADKISFQNDDTLDQRMLCWLIGTFRPSEMPEVEYRGIYQTCVTNIHAYKNPANGEQLPIDLRDKICMDSDFTLDDNCKVLDQDGWKMAQKLAISFGEELYPRRLPFEIKDGCRVLAQMGEDLTVEKCRNEMTGIIWQRAQRMHANLNPWGWDIIGQIVSACSSVFTKHSKNVKLLDDTMKTITGSFYNPHRTYLSHWWQTSKIGLKLLEILRSDASLKLAVTRGDINPTQLSWAYNIFMEYKAMGNKIYSLIDFISLIRNVDLIDPVTSCGSVLNLYIGKFKDNDINSVRLSFSKEESDKLCESMEKESLEICYKYLSSPSVNLARDIRGYFMKEIEGQGIMQLEDICMVVASIGIHRIPLVKKQIYNRCSQRIGQFAIGEGNMTFSQRYGLSNYHEDLLCRRMDFWDFGPCSKIKDSTRKITMSISKALSENGPNYGYLEYRYDELCTVTNDMGDNPPYEKCVYLLALQLFQRWREKSTSFLQLLKNVCRTNFSRRTSGTELKELTNALKEIKEFIDNPNKAQRDLTYGETIKAEPIKEGVNGYELVDSIPDSSDMDSPGVLRTVIEEQSTTGGIEDVRGKYCRALQRSQQKTLNRLLAHIPKITEKRLTTEDFCRVVYKMDQFNMRSSCVALLIELGYAEQDANSICVLADPLQTENCLILPRVDQQSVRVMHQILSRALGYGKFVDASDICVVAREVNVLKFTEQIRQGKTQVAMKACSNSVKHILAPRYIAAQNSAVMRKLCEVLDISADKSFLGVVLKSTFQRYIAFRFAKIYGEKLDKESLAAHPLLWNHVMRFVQKLNPTKNGKYLMKDCQAAVTFGFNRYKQMSPLVAGQACCAALPQGCSDKKSSRTPAFPEISEVSYFSDASQFTDGSVLDSPSVPVSQHKSELPLRRKSRGKM